MSHTEMYKERFFCVSASICFKTHHIRDTFTWRNTAKLAKLSILMAAIKAQLKEEEDRSMRNKVAREIE